MLHHPYQLLRCINSHLHIYFRVKLTKFAENSRELSSAQGFDRPDMQWIFQFRIVIH